MATFYLITYLAGCTFAVLCILFLLAADLRNWFKLRVELSQHDDRRERILGILAERKGGIAPTIEGEFRVVNDLRKSGAL